METELIIYRRSMRIPYRWAAGLTATRFFRELGTEKKIFGSRCPACHRVLVPARQNCSLCFKRTDEWIQVSSIGSVESFTVTHYPMPNTNDTPSTIFALVKLEGADTSFIHRIRTEATSLLMVGMRVEAVFATEVMGNILDIDYFQPVQ